MSLKVLGEGPSSIRILGEATPEEEAEFATALIDPYAASQRRKDEAMLVATGSIPEADDVETGTALRRETEEDSLNAARQVLTEQELDPQTASERLTSIQETGEVVLYSDYWDLERQALKENDPEFANLQALSALKYQHLVKHLRIVFVWLVRPDLMVSSVGLTGTS